MCYSASVCFSGRGGVEMLFEQIPFECDFFLPRSSLNGCTLALMDGSPQCIAALWIFILFWSPFFCSLVRHFFCQAANLKSLFGWKCDGNNCAVHERLTAFPSLSRISASDDKVQMVCLMLDNCTGDWEAAWNA